MRTLVVLLLALLSLFACFCDAQDFPKVDLFTGYSLVNVDTNGLTPRLNASGGEVSVTANVIKYFGIEGNAGAYFTTYSFPTPQSDIGCFGGGLSGYATGNATITCTPLTLTANLRDYSLLTGPRFNIGPIFMHALFGFDDLILAGGSAAEFVSTTATSQTKFASAYGGGVQWNFSRHVGLRLGVDYVVTNHSIFAGPAFSQDNVRASAGLVFLLGRQRTGTPATEHLRSVQPAASNTAFGASGYPTQLGFAIVSVNDDSPAGRLGLNQGDVILEIDHQQVRSREEVNAAIARSTSGTVSVKYMIQGAWTVEHQVKLN